MSDFPVTSLALVLAWPQLPAPTAPPVQALIEEGWSAQGGQSGARFGSALASAGDVNGDGFSDVLVGAPEHDDTVSEEGAAYLFLGSASGLGASPDWTTFGAQAGARFGAALALAGDVNGDGFSDVLVGAPDFDGGSGADEGRVLVFQGSAAGLATVPSTVLLGGQAGARFGSAVATAGDVNGDGFSDVVIGAPEHDDGEANEGRALLFLGSATGLATLASWTSDGNQVDAHHGGAVSTAGDFNGDGFDDVLVGAADFDGGVTDGGRLQLFLGSLAGLSVSPTWSYFGDQASERLGASVATVGDWHGDGFADIVVASPLYESNLNFHDTGRALLFRGSAGATAEFDQVFDGNFAQPGAFSPGCRLNSVASAGDVNGDGRSDLLLGFERFDDGFTLDTGRALLFLATDIDSQQPSLIVDGEQADEWLGSAVALAGDVDGDGYSDLLIGAPNFDADEVDEGRARLYRGTNLPKLKAGNWGVFGGQTGGRLGASVASGDFDADGFHDVLVGSPESNNDLSKEGRVLLYPGSPSGPPLLHTWFGEGNQQNCWFGEALAVADVNGDGFDDAVIGAPFFDGPAGLEEGSAYVFHGSPTGLGLVPDWTVFGGQTNGWFGNSVARAGDVNGDGYDDVLIGAPNASRVFLFLGSASGLGTSPAWTDTRFNSSHGESLSSAGDVNGDGYDDVIIGTPRHGNGQANEGRALVFLGSAAGLATTFAWSAEGNISNERFGTAVCSAGDVNGDGYDDVAIGTRNGDRVLVYHGSAVGLGTSAAWEESGPSTFGQKVFSAGDVNLDGFGDLLVTTPVSSPGNTRAWIYSGAPSGLGADPSWESEGALTAVATCEDLDGNGLGGLVLGEQTSNQGRGLAYHLELSVPWLTHFEQRSADGSTAIERLGSTRLDGLFTLRGELQRNLTGFDWASPLAPTTRLEWEIEPLGTPFDGLDVQTGTAVEPLTPAGGAVTFEELAALIDGSSGKLRDARGRPFHWRVRATTTNPLFPCTPWLGLREFALRKPTRRP